MAGTGARQLVGAGAYDLSAQASATANAGTPSSQASLNLAADLIPVGTLASVSGRAARFLGFGNRSCARNTTRVSLGKAIRTKTRKVTFYVNGRKRTTLTGGELRRRGVVLRRIPPASAGAVKAVVISKKGKRTSARATSWPCR